MSMTGPKQIFKVGDKVQLREEFIYFFSMGTQIGTVSSFEIGDNVYICVDFANTYGFPFRHNELMLIKSVVGKQYEFNFME